MMLLLFKAVFKCNPINMQPKQSVGQGSIRSRDRELKRHDKEREAKGGGAVSHIWPKPMK